MEKEFSLLILNFLTQYWYVLTSFIIFGLLFWEWIPSHDYKNESQKESSKQWMFQSFVFVAMLIFFLVIARGGLQPKPIDRIDAVDYADGDQTAVVLNTPFCIMKTLFKKEKLPYLKYFDEDQFNSIYNPIKKYESTEPFTKKNIVIIILESFGDENVSFSNPKIGNTPFLDSLITKSLYFPNGYANGRVSIDALPSILSRFFTELLMEVRTLTIMQVLQDLTIIMGKTNTLTLVTMMGIGGSMMRTFFSFSVKN
jgi:glucan phosphoethanolaminetransferase (alkaline phosphatase superfamily)